MCDQANHDNCEIVDELHLEITNLEMMIADLKVDFVNDLKGMKEELGTNYFDSYIKKWEGK